MYVAQAIPLVDAEIAGKSHLWTETNSLTYVETMMAIPPANKRPDVFSLALKWGKIHLIKTDLQRRNPRQSWGRFS